MHLPNSSITPAILASAEAFVRKELERLDSSHDFSHIQRVRRLALELAAEEVKDGKTVDLALVELAALLHDVGDYKYSNSHQTTAEVVGPFLESLGVDSTSIHAVLFIIENVSFRHELENGVPVKLTVELAIVQDADRLEAIGAIGTARVFAYGGCRSRPFYSAEAPNIAMDASYYNKQTSAKTGTSLNHFYEKLFHIRDKMKTKAGRIEASRRHAFMREFVAEFEREAGLESHLDKIQ